MANMDEHNRRGSMEMLDFIATELRYIREKLDHHIEDETQTLQDVRSDISRLKEEVASHRTKVGIMSSGIAVVIAAGLTFVFQLFGK